MKVLSILVVSLLTLSSHVATADDAALQQEIIGLWGMGAEDPYFGKNWFSIEYRADGTSVYQTYKSAKCEQVEVMVHGSWIIQNGKLFNTALKGEGGYKVLLGLTFVDDIVQLEDGEMILHTDKGHTVYRSKHQPCAQLSKTSKN